MGKETPSGHLTKEVLRIRRFFIDRSATVTVNLTSVNYRKAPLVLGGLEIPCKIRTQTPGTVSNLQVMERYKQLVEKLYIQ